MVLGLDIHVVGINPPQGSSSSLCVTLGCLKTVTLAYALGCGNFTVLDVDNTNSVEHGQLTGAALAHQKQECQENFIKNLNSISLSVVGHHGKIYSSSGHINNIQISPVLPGSYMRHTNNDCFALQNDTMLMLAHARLKVRVQDCTGPVHAASLSSYSANITLSVSVYDVHMNPKTDLRIAPTGRVITQWRARESSKCAEPFVITNAPTGATMSQPWEPHSPVYDSLQSDNDDSDKDEIEQHTRRMERARRDISVFLAEQKDKIPEDNITVDAVMIEVLRAKENALAAARHSVEKLLPPPVPDTELAKAAHLPTARIGDMHRHKVAFRTQPQVPRGKTVVSVSPLEQQPMDLRLSAFPNDITLVPSSRRTIVARETSGALRVGRGHIPVPQPSQLASPIAAKDESTAYLRRKGGAVGRVWRKHIHEATHGRQSEKQAPLKSSGSSRGTENANNKNKSEKKAAQAMETQALRKQRKSRDAVSRELGGLGRDKPLTVQAAYKAVGGRVVSTYVRDSVHPSTKSTEASRLSKVKIANEPLPVAGAVAWVGTDVQAVRPRAVVPVVDATAKTVVADHTTSTARMSLDAAFLPIPPPVYAPIIYFHK